MTSTTISGKKSMRRIVTASAIAVPLALLPIGVAHANSNDDHFVQESNNLGVTGAPAALIPLAQQVCTGLDNGNTVDTIADALISQLGVKPNRAAHFVALSVAHYCPKYGNLQFGKSY